MDPLDNPAWHALTGEQREFGVVGSLAARYCADVSPIAAVADSSIEATNELSQLVTPDEIVAKMQAFAAAGADHLVVRFAAWDQLAQWERFRADVLPAFRGSIG